MDCVDLKDTLNVSVDDQYRLVSLLKLKVLANVLRNTLSQTLYLTQTPQCALKPHPNPTAAYYSVEFRPSRLSKMLFPEVRPFQSQSCRLVVRTAFRNLSTLATSGERRVSLCDT